ncbi:MAG: DUF3560 domain-containing protein, partial [Oscillospiraceae bacterium]|nr:DUF3560 domain-containing protein [Oscillospiraceae bacterium]
MYYNIDEHAARAAKHAISFSDYCEGSATAEYRSMVDNAAEIAERQKEKVDPMHHGKIDGLLDAYSRRLAENLNESNRITASVPSVMIAGGSNFPVRKKEKQNARADANLREYNEIQGLLDRIRSTGTGGISADDPQALEKLRAKLAKLEKHQEAMKAANAAIRMKDTAKGNARLAELGYSAQEIKQLREPDYCGRVGFPSYELTNNSANMRRIKGRIEELEKRKTAPAPEGWAFDGGTVGADTAATPLTVRGAAVADAEVPPEVESSGY